MRIILGSSSQWRQAVMRTITTDFEIMDPNIDEKAIRDENPQVLTGKLAIEKSRALRHRVSGSAMIITADQVITCGGAIREKPEDCRQARVFLRSYRDLPAVSVTAICGYSTVSRREVMLHDEATVWFKDLTDSAIEHLLDDGVALQCAGGFAVEHPPFKRFIARMDGTPDQIVGFNRVLVQALIDDLGTEV